jgi:nucleoside 2-deoxyribosyltransferase
MVTKVYVAAPWVRKGEAIQAADRLRSEGIEVTSHWFEHEGDPADSTGLTLSNSDIRIQARQDIKDVRDADFLVVLNLEKSEGKAVETGIALAAGIPVISVGKRSNIFQSLGYEVATLDDAIATLKSFSQK